ncbi:cytochrome P450 [Pseudonocardia eucalypti]|uniref:Cytochrome P450 n=1 Tax=Pseudonocardia eucalypti TaxID=648755 RepID=A0ABP9QCU7_9PSEU|nr:cytochrome P450 [Pseudonocardia eucalypti]
MATSPDFDVCEGAPSSVARAIEALPSMAAPDTYADPYGPLGRIRERDPVHFCPEMGFHMVTRYRDAVTVLRDPGTFSSNTFAMFRSGLSINPPRPAVSDVLRDGVTPVAALVWADGAVHARHAQLVRAAFSPRRIRLLRLVIQDLAQACIAAMPHEGEIELVADYAVPISVGVIGNILGVPRQDQEFFHTWTDSFLARLGSLLPQEQDLRAAQHTVQMQHYLLDRIAERRRDRGDDLLSDLVHGHADGEPPLTREELVTILMQLISAGSDTTRGLISSHILELLHRPELLEQVRGGDEQLLAATIEETLRTQPPAGYQLRLTTRETQLGGKTLAAGTPVALMWGAINRDPEKFESPDIYLPGRDRATHHLAFGQGIHVCIGSTLARTESRIAVRALLDAFPHISLATDQLRYLPTLMVRNLAALPLRVGRA